MACHPVTGNDQVLTAQQVYDYAVGAGFDSDTAMIMTAIAGFQGSPVPAESGGHTDCYNGICCYGLWQIYASVHGITDVASLSDPAINASEAKKIYDSQGLAAWSAHEFEINANLDAVKAQVNTASTVASNAGCNNLTEEQLKALLNGLISGWNPFTVANAIRDCVAAGGSEKDCTDCANANKSPTEQFGGIISDAGHFFGAFLDPNNWKIIGMAIAGGLLILLAVVFLAYVEVKRA